MDIALGTKRFLLENKTLLVWVAAIAVFLTIAITVKEVTALLLLAYAVSVLLDPLIERLESHKLSRQSAVLVIGGSFLLALLILLIVLLPIFLREAGELIEKLPSYVEQAQERVKEGSEKFLGVSPPEAIEGLSQQLKETFSGLDQEQVRKIWVAVKKTLLGGYSLTLTILNLLLLPFFIFYISRDLPKLHQFVHHQLPHSARDEIELVLGKMLDKVYAFFRGQLTVSLIMAVLFSIGLVIIGLPLPIAIGALAGLMNIVPYLGGMIGIVLATVVSLVTQGTLVDVLLVWLVFGVVQFLEGNFITPKIIGESVGIHPLIVIVSLIVFGSLFGLLGMIIAIPLAASIGVLAERYLITHEVAATGQL